MASIFAFIGFEEVEEDPPPEPPLEFGLASIAEQFLVDDLFQCLRRVGWEAANERTERTANKNKTQNRQLYFIPVSTRPVAP